MHRPRSSVGFSSSVLDATVKLSPGNSFSGGSGKAPPLLLVPRPALDEYNGSKSLDVSAGKKLKGQCIWAAHKLKAWASSERGGQAALGCLLTLLVVGLWALHAHMLHKASQPRFMVVLDAGSTGTRVHVFSYAADPRSSYAAFRLPEPKLKVEPGLSAYGDDPTGAGASLAPLLAFASQHVPPGQRAATPVLLMGTAGLRLLSSEAADAVLRQCREALAASGFMFKQEWAGIISGTSEGLYGWVAANYASGHLQAAARNMRSRKEPRQPGGAAFKALLEMGGASAQVTFMPDPLWHGSGGRRSKQSQRLSLPGVSRPVWSHSFLGYGFDVVERRVAVLVRQQAEAAAVSRGAASPSSAAGSPQGAPLQLQGPQEQQTPPWPPGAQPGAPGELPLSPQAAQGVPPGGELMDPCLPAGYRADDGRTGSGEWQQCQQLVARVIDPAACHEEPEAPCPEVPAQMPALAGELLAIENFAYTARALALPEHSSVGEFASAARTFCSRPWPQTLAGSTEHPEQQRYLWRYCFGSAFAWTLLHDVLRLGEGQAVHFANALRTAQGEQVGLDWALGAAVLQLAGGGEGGGGAAGGDDATLMRQQQRVAASVLLAALAGTAALSLAAAAAAVRWLGALRAAAAATARVPGEEVVQMAGVWGLYSHGQGAANGHGAPSYSPLPVSTRVTE